MLCFLKSKKHKKIEYRLSDKQFITLLDDAKRAFVLRECEEALKSLEKDREILTSKSLVLIGYIFATLSGSIYAFLHAESLNINPKIFAIMSVALLLLTVCVSVCLVMPGLYEPIYGDSEECFKIFKISTVDIKTIETFRIETMTASIHRNELLRLNRVKHFRIVFWIFTFILVLAFLCMLFF